MELVDWGCNRYATECPNCGAVSRAPAQGCPNVYHTGEELVAPKPPSRLRRWLIARILGLRCHVCGRRAGYGGTCADPDHNR